MRRFVKWGSKNISFFFVFEAFFNSKMLSVSLPFAFHNGPPKPTHDIVRRGCRNLTLEFFV